ncbi:MAG: DUF3048 domain-containing protein [Clostridia bacterium]|nr:DUF3048 domain-containing protein [Clostridia bacterium]
MFKKIVAFVTCVFLLAGLAGCAKKNDSLDVDSADIPSKTVSSEPEEVSFKNPLTGLPDLSEDKYTDRPVAIMVNNISIAQPVQTGLAKADIVYETEVEGGITRLLAVFQDVSKVERIGTVRSARYPYIDLALGHNAVYVHHGQDPIYAAPHLKDVADYTVGTNNSGIRVKNGLASEHTLYASGDKLWADIVNKGWNTKSSNPVMWQEFAEESAPVSLPNAAASVTVPFSQSYKTTFNYDAALGKYIRSFNGTVRKDYISGETENFKNVFVLMTTIRDYPDGYHRRVFLDGGDGYYCTNGTYTPIKWSKGNATSGFVFTNADGTPLKVNAGNSWVCIANIYTSNQTFS